MREQKSHDKSTPMSLIGADSLNFFRSKESPMFLCRIEAKNQLFPNLCSNPVFKYQWLVLRQKDSDLGDRFRMPKMMKNRHNCLKWN